MRCPYCGGENTQVKDSRPTEDSSAIRRRRICPSCGGRFTTFERVQLRELTVLKKNGERRMFDRDKLMRSLGIALRKRPVGAEALETAIESIEARLRQCGDKEVSSTQLGEWVMQELRKLDKVAYVRFASVYRSFDDVSEFVAAIKETGKKAAT